MSIDGWLRKYMCLGYGRLLSVCHCIGGHVMGPGNFMSVANRMDAPERTREWCNIDDIIHKK